MDSAGLMWSGEESEKGYYAYLKNDLINPRLLIQVENPSGEIHSYWPLMGGQRLVYSVFTGVTLNPGSFSLTGSNLILKNY